MIWFVFTFTKSFICPATHAMHAHILSNLNLMNYFLFYTKSAEIPFVVNPVFSITIQNSIAQTNLTYAQLYNGFFSLWKDFYYLEQVQTIYFFTIDSISSQFTFLNSYNECGYLNFPLNPIFTNIINNHYFFDSLTPISLVSYRSYVEFYTLSSYTYNLGLTQSIWEFIKSIELVDYGSLKIPMHYAFKFNSPVIPQTWHPLFHSIADGQYINTSLVPVDLSHSYSNTNLVLSTVSTSSLTSMKTTSTYHIAGVLVTQTSLLFDLLEWDLVCASCNICRYKIFEIPLPWNLFFVNTELNYFLYKDINLINLKWEPYLYEFNFWINRWVDDFIIGSNPVTDRDSIFIITYAIIMYGRPLLGFQRPFIFF